MPSITMHRQRDCNDNHSSNNTPCMHMHPHRVQIIVIFITYYTVLQRLHKGMNCIIKEGKYYVTIYSHGGYLQEANQIVCLRAKMTII